jgi:hypothetical protein
MLLTASQIIEQSWNIFTKHWRTILAYCGWLVLWGAGYMLFVVAFVFVYVILRNIGSLALFLIVNFLFLASIFLASIWFLTLLTTAFSKVIKSFIDQQTPPSFRSLFKTNHHLIWPVVGVSIIVGLIIFGGTLLFVVPGIIFTLWYYFAMYEVIFYEKRGWQALQESKALVVGRWWAVAWRLVVPALFYVFISIIISFGTGLLVRYGGLAGGIFGTFIDLATNLLTSALVLICTLLIYFNLKANPLPSLTTPQ